MQHERNRRATGHVRLVKRKRGSVYYVKYRLPAGRQVQKLLGPAWTRRGRPPAGHYTRRGAEAALRELLVDAERGTLAATDKTGATVAGAAAEYLRYVEQVKRIDPATVADYRGVIDGYLVPRFGETPIEEVTPDAVDAYKEELIGEGRLSNRVIVRHLTVLHGIFKRAKRVWGLSENPASADVVERPQVVYTGEFDTLDRGELDALVRSARDEQDGAVYTVAAFAGLRQGEILALRWCDVDFVSGLLHVRRNYTDRREKVPKGKRVRSVPMTPDVVDALGHLKERPHFTGDDDLVFSDVVGGHLNAWALRRRFYAALEAGGLRRIRFHDLRHAFGSHAIKVLDGYAVQSYMGHAHYSTTQRYLHHKPRREDAAALHEAFGGSPPRAAGDSVSVVRDESR